MQLARIRVGDIVQVDKKGRIFLAKVREKIDRELNILPLDNRETYRTASAREVIGHWKKMK